MHIDCNAKLWKTPVHCEPYIGEQVCPIALHVWYASNLSLDDKISYGGKVVDGFIKNWKECKWRVNAGEVFGIKVINGNAEIVRF